jgi:hypothetical protein
MTLSAVRPSLSIWSLAPTWSLCWPAPFKMLMPALLATSLWSLMYPTKEDLFPVIALLGLYLVCCLFAGFIATTTCW